MPASTSGDARSTAVTKTLGHVLVTGGSGGLASQIISLLLSRSATTKLSAIDLRAPAEPIDGCDYHFGDLTDEAVMTKLFAELKPSVVIHTASPRFDSPKEIMYKVNVEGTKNLVQVAQAAGVKAFVYTSSASVISDCRTDLINADEEYPLVTGDDQPEYYTHTKVSTGPEFYMSNSNLTHRQGCHRDLRPLSEPPCKPSSFPHLRHPPCWHLRCR